LRVVVGVDPFLSLSLVAGIGLSKDSSSGCLTPTM